MKLDAQEALTALEVAIGEAPVAEVPDLIGELERLKAHLWMRLTEAPTPLSVPGQQEPTKDRLLTVAEAAEMMAVTPGWLYRRSSSLPFCRRLSRKALRFSERGICNWLKTRR